MKYGNEENLLNKLFNYLDQTKDEKLEFKPNEFNNVVSNFEDENDYSNETLKKDRNTVIVKENKIICDNIIEKFFELNNEKFLACMDRIIMWDFETCMKEFIMNYYLYIKNDNRLRNYIVMHLNNIILILKDRLEKKLLESIKFFNFANDKSDHQIELLKNDLKNKESVLLGIKSDKFNEFVPVNKDQRDFLDTDAKKDYRSEILNRLKSENPELEGDI
jgi:hypothetical protein